MQDNPRYGNGIRISWIISASKIQELKTRGIHDIILLIRDLVFGKSVEHNYTLFGGINLLE